MIALSGCLFDTAGTPAGDGGGRPDASSPPDAREADAGDSTCAEDIVPSVSIDGVTRPASPGAPLARVVVGDTVELDATGSCVQEGPARYEWFVSPVDATQATLEPGARSQIATLYPTSPERYNVTLRIEDAAGRRDEVTVFGIEAFGWRRLENGGDDPLAGEAIRGVAVGPDRLWITAARGGYVTPLAMLPQVTPIDDALTGATPSDNLGAVAVGDGALWLASQPKQATMWRGGLASDDLAAVPLDEDAEIRALAVADGQVAVAAKQGAHVVTESDDSEIGGEIDAHAVASDDAGTWFGGDRLYRANAPDTPVDPFDGAVGGDAKIRALALGANGELWIGTDGNGVVRADADTGAGVETYTEESSGLPSDKIRAIAVEATGPYAGDVWVATDRGAARLVRDRDVWVSMATNQGLGMRLNLHSLAVAREGAGRGVYAGTSRGVVYIRVP